MENNPNHGNRRRPPDEAYEVKKKRARDCYAAAQLKINPFWLHNKILRDLVSLYGLDTEIPYLEFINRGFDFKQFKSTEKFNGHMVRLYDHYGTYILPNKNLCICKINN
jgi:hypothetical protein